MTSNASNELMVCNLTKSPEEQHPWKEPGIECRDSLIHTICRLHFEKAILFFKKLMGRNLKQEGSASRLSPPIFRFLSFKKNKLQSLRINLVSKSLMFVSRKHEIQNIMWCLLEMF